MYQKQFLTKYELPAKSVLTLEAISALTDIPLVSLYILYNRGQVIERTPVVEFSFNKVVNKKPKGKGMERVYSFIMNPKHNLDIDLR